MKPTAQGSKAYLSRSIFGAFALLASTAPSGQAATTYTWNGSGSTWADSNSWTPSTSFPNSNITDIAAFSGQTTAQTVNLNGTQFALGITIDTSETGTTLIQGGTGNSILNLGANGINIPHVSNTVLSSAGALTIGSTTSGQAVTLNLTANQSWVNYAAGVLTVVNTISNTAASGTVTLSLSTGNQPLGAGGFALNGGISDGIAAKTGLTISSGSGAITIGGVSTYTGATVDGSSQAVTLTGTLGAGVGGGTAITVSGGAFSSFTETTTGVIAGSSSVTVSGANMVITLNGANTYTGNTTLTSGKIQVGVNDVAGVSGALGVGGTISFGTGTLVYLTGANTDYSSRFSTNPFQTYNINTNSQIVTYATNLSSAGGILNKSGAGVLILTAANTYTGATTIASGGNLQLGNGGTTGSIASTTGVANAGNFNIDHSDSLNISAVVGGVISGAGSFTQAGAGTVTINAAETYTGSTALSGGGGIVISPNAGGSLNGTTGTALTFAAVGGNFRYDSTGSSAANSQGMGALTSSAGENSVGTLFGSGGSTALTFASLAARTAGSTLNFVVTGGTTSGATPTNKIAFTTPPTASALMDRGDFYNGSSYAAYDSNGYVRAYNYATDTGHATSAGGATLGAGLTSANSVQLTGAITAQTSVSLNTLNISGNQNIVLGSGTTGGVLSVNGLLKSGNTAGSSTISDGTSNSTSSIKTPTASAELVIRTDGANDVLNLNVPILANGTNALTKSGAGTLVLGGTSGGITNTYTGTTTLDSGTLAINSAGALGNGGAFIINSANATIDNTSGSAVTTSSHVVTMASDFAFGGSNSLTLGGGLALLGASEISSRTITANGAATLTIGGNIANGTNGTLPTSSLIKKGTGTLALNGSNSYTGATTVTAGTLVATGNSAGATSQVIASTTASTTVNMSNTTGLVVGESVTGTAGIASGSYITAINPGVSITLNQNAAAATSPTLTFGAYGALGTGAVLVSGGTLQLGDGTTNATLATNQTITNNATVALKANGSTAQTLANVVSGTGAVTQISGTDILTGANSYSGGTTISGGTLQVGNAGTSGNLGTGGVTNNGALVYNRTDAITEGNAIGGTGSVSQIGSGTTTLTAANTYGGTTTVTAGKLLVNNTTGSGTGSGAVSVASGATLGGTGTIGGSVTLASGSVLTPGNSAGTLTINSGLTLNSSTAGSLLFDLGTVSDKVVVGGTLTLNGQDFTSFTFDTSGGGFGVGTYVLFDASSAIGGSLGSNLTSNQFTGYTATLSLDNLNNDFILTVAVVPEPGTWAMMVGGLVTLMAIHRRRNGLN